MNNKLLVLILLIGLFCGGISHGESLFSANGEGTHFTEHFLASGGIFTAVYLGMHDGLKADKTTSVVFGAFTSLLIGFTYKYMEGINEGYMPHNTGKSMIYNAIGVGSAAVVCVHFDL